MNIILISNHQTWLVCGGRDFNDKEMFESAMHDLVTARGCPNRIVHGAARGADLMADEWAKKLALDIIAVPADWETYGKAAGLIRNEQMLERCRPQLVVAFPGGKGTANMIERARRRLIDVAEVRAAKEARG